MTKTAERRARLVAQGIRPDQVAGILEILAAGGYINVPSRRPSFERPAPRLPARIRIELAPYG